MAWWSAFTAESKERDARHCERLSPGPGTPPAWGLKAAYNARRLRVLDGKTPNQVVGERLPARPYRITCRAGSDDIAKARIIVEAAKEVSTRRPMIRVAQL
jgi:hypothetical protein